MLRVINILSNYSEDAEKCTELYKKLKKGHAKFKYDGHESILYNSENISSIEEYLQIELSSYSQSIRDYVEEFHINGDWFQVTDKFQIDKEDCFNEIADFSSYEGRIWNSGSTWDDSFEEIEKIIKEQAIKVYERIIEEGYVRINNGHFEWR